MQTVKIAFYDTKPYDRKFFTASSQASAVEFSFFETQLNANTAGLSRDHDVVCVFVNDQVDAAVIDQLLEYGVKLIALRCAGYNNVDLKHAADKLTVVRVPGYSPYAVAEHASALMLSLNRHTHQAYHRTRDGNFSINGLLGFDLHNKTAGIIGTGQIGRCMINILQGFGMYVLAFDPAQDNTYAKQAGIRYVSLRELYERSDVISLHCPLTQDTFHMIDEDAINLMKSGVMIINTGRGKLIDTQALIKGLKGKKIGAAGLDVYEEEAGYFFEDNSLEPIADDTLARLLTFPNVLITSHQGFFTQEALTNIAQTTLDNIAAFFNGESLANQITLPPPAAG